MTAGSEIGKTMAGCTEPHLGTNASKTTRAQKRELNPIGIFDPGGRLGLDFTERDRRVVCPRGDREPR